MNNYVCNRCDIVASRSYFRTDFGVFKCSECGSEDVRELSPEPNHYYWLYNESRGIEIGKYEENDYGVGIKGVFCVFGDVTTYSARIFDILGEIEIPDYVEDKGRNY